MNATAAQREAWATEDRREALALAMAVWNLINVMAGVMTITESS